MKTKTVILSLLAVLAITCSATLNAQQNREIGVRLLASQGSDVIFKKEKKPNRFKRFRVGLSNLGYIDFNGNDRFVFSAGAGFGWEKRKAIKENLHFVTGLEFQAGIASIGDNSNGVVGIGYILGFQYDINENLSVGVETVPNISTNFGDNFDSAFSINAGVNSTAALSLIYRFQK